MFMKNIIRTFILAILLLRPFFSGMSQPSVDWSILFALLLLLALHSVKVWLKGENSYSTYLDLPIFTFGIFLTIGLFFSPSRAEGIDSAQRFLSCFALFYLILHYAPKEEKIRFTILLSASLVSLYGIYQYFFGLEETRRFISLYQLPQVFADRASSSRIFSTFMYPNSLAGYLILVFPIALSSFWSQKRRWLYLICLLLILVALYLSGSKGGLITLSAILFLFFIKKNRLFSILTLSLFLLLCFYIFLPLPTSFLARLCYWKAAVKIIADSPLFGMGLSSFSILYFKYKSPFDDWETKMVHNDYLQIGVEMGLLGLCSWLWFVIAFAIKGQKAVKRKPHLEGYYLGAIGSFIHSSVDFDLYIPGISLLLFLFIGLVVDKKEASSSKNLSLFATILSLTLSFYALQISISYRHYENGISSLFVKEYESALTEFEKASALFPQNHNSLFYRGYILTLLGRKREAIPFYKKAVLLKPCSSHYHYCLAQALIDTRGERDEIIRHLKTAVDCYPTKVIYRIELGWFLLASGKKDEAEFHLLEGIRLANLKKKHRLMNLAQSIIAKHLSD
jgi:O-antigen ligase